jgi:hypothetical protein
VHYLVIGIVGNRFAHDLTFRFDSTMTAYNASDLRAMQATIVAASGRYNV